MIPVKMDADREDPSCLTKSWYKCQMHRKAFKESFGFMTEKLHKVIDIAFARST